MNYRLTVLVLFLAFQAAAQRSRQLVPIYVPGTAYKSSGWFISPGITYMLPEDRRQEMTNYQITGSEEDTIYSGRFSRGGRIGLYVEAGRHKFFTDRYILDHIDYGVHFKMLRGRENFDGTGIGGVPVNSPSTFSESFAGAFFNASHISQISDRFWIQNSLGVNADYRIIANIDPGMAYGANWMYPSTLLAQVHYKLGFGWKPEPGIYIMPMIETPILTGYPWDDGKSTLQYFTGRYRPIIITLRIQWLSKEKDRTCVGQPGKDPEVDPEKSGRHKHNDLWGPEGKKMKRKKK